MRHLPIEIIEHKKQLFQQEFITRFSKCLVKKSELSDLSGKLGKIQKVNRINLVLGIMESAISAVAGIAAIPTAGATLPIAIISGAGAVISFGVNISEQVTEEVTARFREKTIKIKPELLLSKEIIINQAAYEIARIYEYQISLVQYSDIPHMASAAVARIINYLEHFSETNLDAPTILESMIELFLKGVMHGHSEKVKLATDIEQKHKWNTQEVFSAPAIRTCNFNTETGHIERRCWRQSTEKKEEQAILRYGYRESLYAVNEQGYETPDNSGNDHIQYMPTTVRFPWGVINNYALSQRGVEASKQQSLNTWITERYSRPEEPIRVLCRERIYPSELERNLSGGNFEECDFSYCKLEGIDFGRANFKNARLVGTILCKTNLTEATLENTCLMGANLAAANFAGTICHRTDFTSACLNQINLNACTVIKKVKTDGAQCNVDFVTLPKRQLREIIEQIATGEEKQRQQRQSMLALLENLHSILTQGTGRIESLSNIAEPIHYCQPRRMLLSELGYRFNQCRQIAIIGISGSGKTQLAIEYAARAKMYHPEKIVWKFNAGNTESLMHEYINFAIQLRVDKGVLEQIERETDITIRQRAVRNLIEKQLQLSQGYILIFDNAPTRKIEIFLPFYPFGRGEVIITSQNARNFEPSLENWAILDISHGFTEIEVQEFFKDISRDTKEIARLTQTISYLPLGLAAAKLYIQDRRISINEYLVRIASYDTKSMVERRQEVLLSSTNQESVIKLAINALSSDSRELLDFCAFLAQDNIPFLLLIAWLKQKRSDQEQLTMALEERINGLRTYSLCSVQGINSTRSISFHALIQEIAMQLLYSPKTTLQPMVTYDAYKSQYSRYTNHIRNILQILTENFTRDNRTPQLQERHTVLLPHVEAILAHSKHYDDSEIKTLRFRLEVCIGAYYTFISQYRTGREILQKTVEQLGAFGKDLAQEDARRLTIYAQALYHLGRTCFYIQDHSEKYQKYLIQAVCIRQVIDTDPGYDDLYNDAKLDSILFQRSGTLQFLSMQKIRESLLEAEQGYLQLIEKGDEFNRKICCRELSTVYKRLAKLEEPPQRSVYYEQAIQAVCNSLRIEYAEGNYQAILDQLQVRAAEDSRIAQDYNNIARILLSRNNLEDAMWAPRFFVRAKQIEEAKGSAGNNFPLANALYSLAKIYMKRDDTLPQAKDYIYRCIQIREQMGISVEKAKNLQAQIHGIRISETPNLWCEQRRSNQQPQTDSSIEEFSGPPIK